jgi:hypothetical protein
MRDSFNVNFYVVAATVIPIFYLTLTLQGPFFEDLQGLARTAGNATQKWLGKLSEDETRERGLRYRLRVLRVAYTWVTIGTGLFFFGLLIVLASVASEGISLWSLLNETDSNAARQFVLWSMIALLGLMAIKPTVAIYRVSFVNWQEDPKSSSESNKST